MTHADLVQVAAKWLRSHGYGTVIAEKLPAGLEEPDAIGWKSWAMSSFLIECKVSRADFLRDREKPHRKHPALGMGLRRIYLATPGLISAEELPERWGLAVTTTRGMKLIVHPQEQPEIARHREMELLIAYIRRVEGVSKRIRSAKAAIVETVADVL